MFDEASAVELVAEMLVESVCVWPMIAAGNLDASAAMLPSKSLRCGNEQPTNAALPIVWGDNETSDPAKRTVGVKQRDAMKRNDAHYALPRLGNENGGVGRSRAIRQSLLDVGDWGGITKSRQ
jgi:hypothetical protein